MPAVVQTVIGLHLLHAVVRSTCKLVKLSMILNNFYVLLYLFAFPEHCALLGKLSNKKVVDLCFVEVNKKCRSSLEH